MFLLAMMIEHRIRKSTWLLRGFIFKMYLRIHGCKVGRRLKCKQWPILRQIPQRNIALGNDMTVGYRVTIDVGVGGMLTIADHVNLTQDLVISCGSELTIGAYTGVGEYSSIRDGEHGIEASRNLHGQQMLYTPIIIGRDVQVGRGCTVLGGAVLGDGTILGANCIAGRNFRAAENGIYFGTPPKLIGKRPNSGIDSSTAGITTEKVEDSPQ